jgi:molecular chaperone GrpE
VDTEVKETLLDQFRCYLDGLDAAPQEIEADSTEAGTMDADNADAGSPEADLFTVFVELAALRNEVRTESRLVKEALDQFRGVFGTLQSSHATLEQELKRARAEAQERGRALLRPLLLELLDLHDRLAAGLRQPVAAPVGWLDRWRGRRPAEPESWREGLGITMRRLNDILAGRRVMRLELMGQRFDPRIGRVVATTNEANVGAGIVVEEVRAGFLWEDELLRPAEVIVNQTGASEKGL